MVPRGTRVLAWRAAGSAYHWKSRCHQYRARPVLTGETVLEMATIHGAAALGMSDEVGSIEPGKRADIVVHTVDRPEAHPRFQDPVDNLIFYRSRPPSTRCMSTARPCSKAASSPASIRPTPMRQ